MVEKSISGIVTWLGNWFQDKLVSGSNIKKISCNNTEYDLLSNPSTNLNFKTVNGNNLVGVGDISISGGGSSAIACVSDMGLDDTVPTDVELYLDACNGKVIDSISKSTSGLVDTYTITYDDNSTYVFTVTNGSDATVDIVTNTNGWNSTTSDSKVPSEKLVKNSLDSKSDSTHSHNSHISYGRVDSTSTSTVFTATVSGVTELVDGTTVMLRNGYVTSASGFTLNVNNLGAKPVYNSMADATADTTIFNINYTMLFVYDSTRVTGGCWICYRGYNSNDNTIGYQIRTNNSVFTTTDKGYRYRIWLETDDGKYMPVNTSTSTNATANRSSYMNTRKFWLGGKIVYNSTKADYQADVTLPTNTMWQQYNFALGYSFNNTGSALTLTSGQPLYMVCTDEGGGKGKLASPYYTQTLPSSADGKLYIYLGHMTSAVNMELALEHPIYEYKNGSIRLYRDTYTTSEVDTLLNGKSDTGHTHSGYANSTHTHTKSQITDFPNLSTVATSGSYNDLSNKPTIPTVPTNVSAFTNDSGYLTSHQSLTNYIQKSNTNGLIKNDGTIDTSSYLTTGTASSTYVAKENGKGLFSGSYNDLTNKPTIPTVPTNVSAFTNDSGYLTSHQDITGKLDKAQTSYKGKNVVVDSTSGNITFEDKNNHTHSQYLTEHQSLTNYIQKSSTNGLVKNDGSIDTSTYLTSHQTLKTINNESIIGSGNINITTQGNITVDSALSSTSENPLQNKAIYTALSSKADSNDIPTKTSDLTNDSGFLTSHQDISNYVQKSNTTGLLKNDGSVDTSTYLTSHQSLANYIQKSNTSGLIKNDGTIDTTSYSTFDGNYNNLTDKPTIPTQTSQLTNNSGFITSSSVPTIADNLTTNDSTQVLSAKQGKVLNTNKIETSAIATSFSSTTSDSKVPSEKLTKTELDKKITKSNSATGLLKDDGTVDTNSYLTTANASSTYVAKETGKGLFSGSYSDLSNKPSYTATITSSTANSYKIGSINISGSSVDIYGKDTDTVFSGSYNDLTDTPSIPTDLSDLSDSNSLIPSVVTDSNGWNSTLSDEEIPSEKLVKNSLDNITITDFGIDDTDVDDIELYIEIGTGQTEQSFIFYDDCTTDNTSQYSDVIKFTSTSASATLSFNSNSTDYSFVGSGGDYFVGRVIPNIRGEDNIRISVKVKLTNNSAYNQFFIGLSDNLSYSSGNSFTADMFRIRGDNKSDYLHNSGNEVSGSSSTTSVYNNWVTVIFERNGTSITGKIFDSSNTLIREYSYTTANSYTNPYYFIGLNARYSSSTKEINDIKVERM